MSSYGHPHHQADDAGHDAYDSYGQYQDSYAVDSYGADPYPADRYRDGSAGSRAVAGVGAAAAGRARVTPPAGPTDQPRPRYDWSRAAGQRAPAGRATVPVSPGVGPATGRATVRPIGPGGPGAGRPGVSGAGRGRPPGKKKKHWLRNSLLIALAVLIIMTGGGMVGLSYYVDSVPPPEQLDLAEASTVLFNDGREMATLQEVNREIIDTTAPELANIRNAVIAAEDKDFYDHSGVDFVGIMRAAWNNVTGGERQGASTIDQQYARAAAKLTEDTYRRKLQEAAMAYKMNQELTKDEILDFYLNTIYLGRGAYGVQAAAEAYFNKPAAELSVAEAAVIAGVIRIPDDGSSLSPYDPRHEAGPAAGQERFNYVLDQLVDTGALSAAERAEMTELPETIEPKDEREPFRGPQGPIVRQIQYELERRGITDLTTGGYRITTTVDREMQAAARDAARRQNKADHWAGMPKNVDAAMAAIRPEDGAVLAYYGGEDGTAYDLAGPNRRELEDGTVEWYGGRPPGSSFKVYTLIAELRDGISFDTHWKTSEFDPDWLEGNKTIRNAGRVADSCEGVAPDYCTLRWSTQLSYNVPFAYYSQRTDNGPMKIVQAAKDAGIRMMTDDRAESYDLTATEAGEVAPNNFFHPVAYGQYSITVLDHASGLATLAARGMYHEPHFVAKVEQKINGEWVPVEDARIVGEQRVEQQYADAITKVLETIPGVWGFSLDGGRPAAAKTGTWEFDHPEKTGNNDAWVVGYTPQIAAAVWVGDSTGENPIKDGAGEDIGSSGLPAQIWQQFMNDAHAAKDLPPQQFPPALPVGNRQSEIANGELPRQNPRDDDCLIPIFCDDDRGGDNGGGDGDNGGGNGDGDNGGGNGDGDEDNDGEIVLPIPTPTQQPGGG